MPVSRDNVDADFQIGYLLGRMNQEWEREIQVDGECYVATFIRRPFREGMEVYVDCRGTVISVSELGLGEAALLERISELIREHLAHGKRR